jgi:glucosylceramidase
MNQKEMENRMSEHKGKVRLIQTARDSSDRLSEKPAVSWVKDEKGIENGLLNVYPDVRYQEIEGFGGAFTEAGAVTLKTLGEEKRKEVLEAYFHPERGLGYSFCRTHIHSCDFSLGNYTYVQNGDTTLESFDITRDREALIPFIKGAQQVEGASFRLLATPWSPPPWMKTNGQMNGGGSLLPKYRPVWAEYYVKYIRAYEQEGIPVWGLSVQNEAKAVQRWDSCIFTAEEERDFVRDHLGPTLEKAGLSDVNLLIWDHNKERVYDRAKVAYTDPAAAKYLWGIGFHWYSGDHFGGLEAAHQRFPDKKLLFTEGCVEGGVAAAEWANGEKYAHHMIGDLNHWASGWIDWNLLLNEIGGPNHVENYCDAPIIADTRTGEIEYHNSYYYIGQISKYVRPGAVRIGSSSYTDALETVAFDNPDGSVAVIVLNRTESEVPFQLRAEDHLAAFTSPARSIQTLMFHQPE